MLDFQVQLVGFCVGIISMDLCEGGVIVVSSMVESGFVSFLCIYVYNSFVELEGVVQGEVDDLVFIGTCSFDIDIVVLMVVFIVKDFGGFISLIMGSDNQYVSVDDQGGVEGLQIVINVSGFDDGFGEGEIMELSIDGMLVEGASLFVSYVGNVFDIDFVFVIFLEGDSYIVLVMVIDKVNNSVFVIFIYSVDIQVLFVIVFFMIGFN